MYYTHKTRARACVYVKNTYNISHIILSHISHITIKVCKQIVERLFLIMPLIKMFVNQQSTAIVSIPINIISVKYSICNIVIKFSMSIHFIK